MRSHLGEKVQFSYSDLSHLWSFKRLIPSRHIFKHRTNNPLKNTKIKILTWELCCLVYLTNIYECKKLLKKLLRLDSMDLYWATNCYQYELRVIHVYFILKEYLSAISVKKCSLWHILWEAFLWMVASLQCDNWSIASLPRQIEARSRILGSSSLCSLLSLPLSPPDK